MKTDNRRQQEPFTTVSSRVCLGSQLIHEDQQHVLRAYVHRYTGDHKPLWACQAYGPRGLEPAVQFADDNDWLANTYFKVTKRGRLNHAARSCHSCPTWPNDSALRSTNGC